MKHKGVQKLREELDDMRKRADELAKQAREMEHLPECPAVGDFNSYGFKQYGNKRCYCGLNRLRRQFGAMSSVIPGFTWWQRVKDAQYDIEIEAQQAQERTGP